MLQNAFYCSYRILDIYPKNNLQDPHSANMAPEKVDQNAEKPCGWCNKPGHGAASAAEVRRQLCPAWGKDCSKCGKKGHFGSACNSNMKEGGVDTGQLKHVGHDNDDDEAESDADEPVGVLGSLVGTGLWCAMSATSGDGGQTWGVL